MGAPPTASAVSTAGERLKREDFKHTRHDSAFSRWKILIGASDWKDYSLGKGAEKYRTQNLPNCASCPGVYELGVGVSCLRSGGQDRKLDSSDVVPVYLGQADNVRTRLQRYGREGAHLENEYTNDKVKIRQIDCSDKGLCLFTEIFSRGFPIVYRWAPMKSKKDAEKTESQLLENFDYAWNKGSNGVRRPKAILEKLDHNAKESQFSLLAKKLQFLSSKKVGIRITIFEPFLLENGDDLYNDVDNNGILSRIFKIGRARPIPVSSSFSTPVCGVAVGHGSICTRPAAVEGRKRCSEHKGMKVNGLVSKLNTEMKDSFDGFENQCASHNIVTDQASAFGHPVDDEFAPICGVVLDSGSPCKNKPVLRNKRCLEHKGRRVSKSATKFTRDKMEPSIAYENGGGVSSKCAGTICGIDLGDGKPCTCQPVSGRKRCNLHKGMRLKRSISRLSVSELSTMFS